MDQYFEPFIRAVLDALKDADITPYVSSITDFDPDSNDCDLCAVSNLSGDVQGMAVIAIKRGVADVISSAMNHGQGKNSDVVIYDNLCNLINSVSESASYDIPDVRISTSDPAVVDGKRLVLSFPKGAVVKMVNIELMNIGEANFILGLKNAA
jgi:CheY-specific phosphatase CheX